MFRMWDVRHVGCSGCSGCGMFAWMWDVDLQNAYMFCRSSEKMPKSFTIVSNIVVTTRVTINESGAKFFIRISLK